MAIKLPSHLHRSRSGILHFRIAIPPDLRHHFASREIYRSLRTPNVRDAASAAQGQGGFLGRKSDGESGVKTIWNGFMKVRLVAEALREAHSTYG